MMSFRNKEPLVQITVTDLERRIIVQALSDLKDKQKLENKSYDFIDELIIKSCDAGFVNEKVRKHEER